jgi:hypothetical protein
MPRIFAAQEQGAAKLADTFLSLARHLRVNQPTPDDIKLDDIKAIEPTALREPRSELVCNGAISVPGRLPCS